MSRRVPLAAVVVLLASLVAGCSSLPDRGTVEVGGAPAASDSSAPFDFNPPGPVPGASPEQIVIGFLRALQATPVSTRVAEQFLTDAATEDWHPDRRTLVYETQQVVESGSGVTLDLGSTFELDARGHWLAGAEPAADGAEPSRRRLRFRLHQQGGEWRITDPPDAMVIPRSHFETRYEEFSLYFFDPSGSVLVPEPVYLPLGVQTPTMLVSGLLQGPSPAGREVERTFVPRGTELGVGVPVRADGVAEVPLSAEMRDLGTDQLDLVLAQIAWTLRQVDGVEAFTVTVDGTPLEVPGGRSTVDVGGWGEFSPTDATASTDLFGLRERRVVQVQGDDEAAVATVQDPSMGVARSLGVNLLGQRFAVVSEGGSRVEVLSRSGGAADAPVTEVHYGADLLRPAWDRTDRLWLFDRTATGTRVVVVTDGKEKVLDAPALSGARARAAALSRDGTRLVVAVPGPGPSTTLLLFRVVRAGAGAPVQLTEPSRLTSPEPLTRVRALGWRDPTTVAALTRPSSTTTQVVPVACDGSSAAIELDPPVDVLFDRGVALAASPGGRSALMVGTRDGTLHALDPQGRWDFDVGPSGLRAPTFVG